MGTSSTARKTYEHNSIDLAQHLGRAKDVGEFVKHGTHEAMIEIELCGDGKKFRQNPVIRCLIKRESNKSQYSINGKPANKKQVLALARSLSIQVDNLCQFLPQDKVVEFAAMTPVELLRSTQRAIASPEMIEWHEQLKELRKSQRQLETREKTDKEELVNLENRQRMQEADVERLRERESVKQSLTYLEKARPIAAYRDNKEKLKDAKTDRNRTLEELRTLENEVEPALRAVNAKQTYRDAVKAALDGRTRNRDQAATRSEEAYARIEELQKEIDHGVKALERESKNLSNARQDENRLLGVIKGLKKRIEQPPTDFDFAAINDRIVSPTLLHVGAPCLIDYSANMSATSRRSIAQPRR